MKSDDFSASSSDDSSFTFIQCADTQYGLIDRYVLGVSDESKITWTREIKYLKLLIQAVNSMQPKPKFMVIWYIVISLYLLFFLLFLNF